MKDTQVGIEVSPEPVLVILQRWSLASSGILGDELEGMMVILHNCFQVVYLGAEVLKMEGLQHVG